MRAIGSYDADFSFLGAREYVHGTSMTHSLMEAVDSWEIGPVGRLGATFHTTLHEQGTYDLFRNEGTLNFGSKNYASLFQLECSEQSFVVGLRGRGEPVIERAPYDEEQLICSCKIQENDKSAVLMYGKNSNFINVVVALNKRLLLAALETKGFKQWFLAKYSIDYGHIRPDHPELLTITLMRSIGDTNTRSLIRLGSKVAGHVYFSREVKV